MDRRASALRVQLACDQERRHAFDVCATYTKSTRRLELAASVTPELVASHGRSQEGGKDPPPL